MNAAEKFAAYHAIINNTLGDSPRNVLVFAGFSFDDIAELERLTKRVLKGTLRFKESPRWVDFNAEGKENDPYDGTYTAAAEYRYQFVNADGIVQVLATVKRPTVTVGGLGTFECDLIGYKHVSPGHSRNDANGICAFVQEYVDARYSFVDVKDSHTLVLPPKSQKA